MLPQTKLDALIARHAEIEARLNGQLAADEFVRLSRELSDLGPVVDTIKSYRSAASEMTDLQSLIDDPKTDSEMREIADSERRELRDRLPQA